MRILQVSSAKTFGGGERHLVDLCRGLANRGNEIFAALRPTNEWEERLDFLPEENFLHVSIRNSFGMFSAKKIARFAREKNIEIIHAHVARDYLPVSLACRIAPASKFVLTRHVLFPMNAYYKFTLKNVVKAIAVSSAAFANLQAIFPREKIALVPNGVEVKVLSDAEKKKLFEEFRFFHNISFDALLIGTVGELKRLKGQQDFILAANEIAKKFPEAYFVIVGKDYSFNQEFRRELKRLVKVFNLEDRFLFLDWLEDLSPLLAALDVFVSASHTESFGLATLEAMAGGKAVVATETEGAKELLEDGKSGRLVPVREPLKLAEAVGDFLNDKEMRKRSGENALAAAKEKFSLEKMIEETERIYREILS